MAKRLMVAAGLLGAWLSAAGGEAAREVREPNAVGSLIALSNDCGRVAVDTYGATVLSYVPADGDEVLFRAQRPRLPVEWYHGGIPVCWPWFGRYGDPGSCMHGLARLHVWEVVSREDSPRLSRLRLRLRSGEATARDFDGSFELDYEIVLADSLRLVLTMRNTGVRRFAVTAGFHPYFRVRELADATVRTPTETIRCEPGMDGGRAYADGTYLLSDGERRIRLTSRGNRKLVVWNPGPEHPEFAPDEWRRFACVEPAVLPRMEGLWLLPGAACELEMSVRAEKEER